MPNLAYKQPALQRNKPMDYAKPAGKGKGSSMKKKATTKKKKQGYNARLDESLGMRKGKASSKKQSMKSRRDESKGMAKKVGKKRAYGAVKTMDKKR
tara:strand:+ start:403 stop:693 length:291 start_codon:yes stop_codon:yes gene_type:complete